MLGYSAGGVIAYAMAGRLLELGEQVTFLGLIDSLADPTEEPFFRETLAALERQTEADARDATALLATMAPVVVDPSRQQELTRLGRAGDVSTMIELLRRGGEIPSELDESAVRRLLRVQTSILCATGRYRPSPRPLSATLFRAARDGVTDPTLGWGALLRDGLRVVPVDGDHFTSNSALCV